MPNQSPPRSGIEQWSRARLLGFRFVFCYLVLYNLPFPLSVPPIGGPVASVYDRFWHAFIPWLGDHVLHLATPITVFPSGSGDTRFNYVQVLVFAVLAVVATVVWSTADRKRPDYHRLEQWLTIYIRYALAFPLLTYGAAKLVKLQFPIPALETLLQPYRDLSPQGALWAYMGLSYPYNLFTGLAESVPGILLLFRRTKLLGALLGAAVMANVAFINFAYDVPVKLYSSHLFLMAAFLVAADARRLIDLFLRNRAVPAADPGPYPATPKLRLARWVVKAVVVVVAVVVPLVVSATYARQYGDRAPKPPLYGIYDVTRFVRGRDTVPALTSDSTRWRRLVISRPGAAGVRLMNGSARTFLATVDSGRTTLTLAAAADSAHRYPLSWREAGAAISLDGLLLTDTLHVQLRRVDVGAFRVLSGFRWFSLTELVIFGALAAALVVGWSTTLRRYREDSRSYPWFTVVVRYALGLTMILYGVDKLVKLQFPTPSLETMLQPFGDLTPQGALWTWMGISYSYDIFTGLAEVIPGILLLFRRTKTLGALLSAVALANIVALNFAYDVPVKVVSSLLLLMAILVLSSDARQLLDLLIRNRPVAPLELGRSPTIRLARRPVKAAVLATIIGIMIVGFGFGSTRISDWAPRPPLYGIYDVDTFVRGRDTVPPLLTDRTRWDRLVIGLGGTAGIHLMDGSKESYRTTVDGARRQLRLASPTDSTRRWSLAFSQAGETLSLDGDSLHVRLRRVDVAGFRVLSGFRWVRE